MALQTAYKQFLAAPNPSFLAEDASLHYITTLVTVNGASAIIKHLKSQDHDLKKNEEKFLDVVEGPHSLAVEAHTTIEFLTGGGSYLPSLDDNFLADRVVTFPIIHIVNFDANGKILQVRQNWDQGSLLKLIDVIGKTGRNWPIRDGKDQIKLITSSVKSAGKLPVDSKADEDTVTRSRGNSNNVTRDPHASLSLFAPREKNLQDSLPAVVPPRASARPAPREYSELFVGNDSEASTSPSKAPGQRPESPSKAIASKIGAGKNFAPSRLFDNDENSPIRPSLNKDHSADHYLRANPAKYQHFDIAHVDEAHDGRPTPLKEVKSSKHGSQWNFDDFNTPAKFNPSKVLRTNDVRHWGNNSDDENIDSPIKFKKVDKPRKDAETHFEFEDDGTLEGGPRLIGRPRGAGQNTGPGLYKDTLFSEEDGASDNSKGSKTLNTIANTKDRRKDFDPHFTMTDDSPASKPPVSEGGLRDDRAKAVKMMDANWSTYDQSPNQKENSPLPTSPTRSSTFKAPLSDTTNAVSNRNDQSKGITIAGDGMGSRKGAVSSTDKAKGINVGGDGMGGKKGSGRQWGIGDGSDGEEAGGINKPSKYRTGKQGKVQATGGDFWDF
ncbi:hypothetical protein D0Z07_5797 [Hyphodiscus hymeniophilus]|uniref:NTF2-like protein n=1 Tax=Hyphodiscus hymeniophilus TaxID=353542 RepID=A0A9P6VHM1_9HELO|nr:hypothetical protein D0Z07_5797 [Hyphodiscus hymeniophilus]